MTKEWIKKLEINENDGLIPLLNLFNSDEDLYQHLIRSSVFNDKIKVEKQQEDFLDLLVNKDKFPVRFTMKSKDHFLYENNNLNIKKVNSKKRFETRKEAKIFAEKYIVFHDITKINVKFDGNGNYFVKQAIENRDNDYKKITSVSSPKNFVICHIWGRTHHPLFFSSLWNVIQVPAYLSFLTDKPAIHSKFIGNIQLILKAICFDLYEPHKLYPNFELFEPAELKDIEEGKKLIETFNINIKNLILEKTAL